MYPTDLSERIMHQAVLLLLISLQIFEPESFNTASSFTTTWAEIGIEVNDLDPQRS